MNKIIIIAGNEEGCGVTTIDISKLQGEYLVISTKSGHLQNLSTDRGCIADISFVANQTSIENSGDEYVDTLACLMESIGDKTKVQLAYEKVYNEPIFKSLHETKNELDLMKKEITELKKEIDYLKPRTWFADALDNIGNAFVQAAKDFKLKAEDPPRKKLTKREKFWHDVKENNQKYGGQWICVYPKDYEYFIKELEKELPTVVWGNAAKPSEYDPWMSQKRRYVYLDNKDFIYWSTNPGKSIAQSTNKKVFTYRPPMDWERFKKGEVVVKVNNVKEFDTFVKASMSLWGDYTDILWYTLLDNMRKMSTDTLYIISVPQGNGTCFFSLTASEYKNKTKFLNTVSVYNWSDMR